MNSLTPGPDITIAEKLQTTATAKSNIATAITNKGGTVPTKFVDYGTAVSSLPNTYTAGDEGKVVSNGALVSQTSLTITENNTYDTTTKNSVTVNVSGGGGGGPFDALVDRSITTITAQDLSGVTTIGSSAFANCSGLTSITIPGNVTSIGNYAFQNCSGLTSFLIGNSVTTIGSSAFSGCSNLASVTIPSSVTSIGNNAFYRCSHLTSITIGTGVTTIGASAFGYCDTLQSVTVSDSVENIDYTTFDYDFVLTVVDFGTTRNTIPTMTGGTGSWYNPWQGTDNLQILVPSNLVDSWKAATNWSKLASKIVAHP